MVLHDTSIKTGNVDTIAAKATAAGKGGVGIVRISGPDASHIAMQILGKTPKIRSAEYLAFLDKEQNHIDQGIALFFKGPNSLTGEDVLELQGHGGAVVMDCLLKSVLDSGARLARPGEFLERAFLNNKIDLLQAEAVHDLIHATTEAAAKGAMRSMKGAFSQKIQDLVKAVIELRMFVETAIDFPDEELDLLQEDGILSRFKNLRTTLTAIQQEASRGILLSEGLKIVIAGKPNAGKSSLLNVLSGYDAAIVSDIPGTTRDVLKEEISIDGLRLQLVDTAGLRTSGDSIEQEGMRRAHREMKEADCIVLVVDGTESLEASRGESRGVSTEESTGVSRGIDPIAIIPELAPYIEQKLPLLIFCNKMDLLKKSPGVQRMNEGVQLMTDQNMAYPDSTSSKLNYSLIYGSALTGEGIDFFREELKRIVGFQTDENTFTARRRHLEALTLAVEHVISGENLYKKKTGFELVAEELRLAQVALDEITGKFTADDLLGKIFSEFCIGK